MKSSGDYNNMMLDIANAYKNEYKNMPKEQFSSMIEKEVVADYLGENLGNQEFVNDLVRSTNKTQVQKIIDWVKNKITSLKNVVTGNKELNYWNKIKENFERAYNQEYQGDKVSVRFVFKRIIMVINMLRWIQTKIILMELIEKIIIRLLKCISKII